MLLVGASLCDPTEGRVVPGLRADVEEGEPALPESAEVRRVLLEDVPGHRVAAHPPQTRKELAGALKDHRRAVVIGTQSFGKGSVQSVIPLRNEGAMRLTTSRYYTPSGRAIQALGVSPDIIVDQPPRAETTEAEGEERPNRSEADLRGRLENDAISEDERRQLEEEKALAEASARLRKDDYQLAYAIDLLRGLSAIERE
ncbi:MAG: S41 family peptidase, partial [Gemmobacter sp.]